METVSLKMENALLSEIDGLLKSHRYSTRTEFIREAIRDKLKDFEKEDAIKKLEKLKGAAKVHVSDERLHEIGEEIAREYAKKFGIEVD